MSSFLIAQYIITEKSSKRLRIKTHFFLNYDPVASPLFLTGIASQLFLFMAEYILINWNLYL